MVWLRECCGEDVPAFCALPASKEGAVYAKAWPRGKRTHDPSLARHFASAPQGISDVAWAPGDAYVATASDDHNVRLWDAASGACLRRLLGHTHYVMCCAFSAAGSLLASGSFDETIVIWDVATGQAIRTVPGHSDPITAVAFSHEALQPAIVSSSFDGLL